jgi:putative MFS transporter
MLELLERQERLTVNQWKLISAVILGGALGSSVSLLSGFALGSASVSQHLAYAQSPLIHQSSGVGTVLGAIFWGWMADRVGRRKAFIATQLNVSLASGIMAMTPEQGGLIFLTVCFFLASFGASGLFVAFLPLVQEFVPASKRGWISGLVVAIISVGISASSLPGARLAVRIGWRALFAVGLFLALVILLIRAWVPESPRWLIGNGLIEDARRSLAWALRFDPQGIDLPADLPKMPHTPWHDLIKHWRSVAITCVISVSQMGGVASALWGGLFFSILKITGTTFAYLMLGLVLAGLPGQFVMSYLSDAIGRRKSGMLCGFGAALSLALAGYCYDAFFGAVPVLWLLMAVASFFGVGSMAIVRPYTAEVWPMGLRARGMGLAQAVGGLGGLLALRGIELIIGAPSFASPQATPASVSSAMLFLAAWSALAGLVFWLFAIETKGRSIEEIDAVLARPHAAAD